MAWCAEADRIVLRKIAIQNGAPVEHHELHRPGRARGREKTDKVGLVAGIQLFIFASIAFAGER